MGNTSLTHSALKLANLKLDNAEVGSFALQNSSFTIPTKLFNVRAFRFLGSAIYAPMLKNTWYYTCEIFIIHRRYLSSILIFV